MLLLLGLTAGIVWLNVANKEPEVQGVRCDPGLPATAAPGESAPPAPPQPGEHIDQTGLDQTSAAPPEQVTVKVLNASTQRGEAAQVTENLKQLNFTQIGTPSEDPQYPSKDMTCRGQIRFGQQGAAAARTLSLLEPCLELVKDNRQDASVEMVIGRKFDELAIRPETRQILRLLSEWGAQHPPQSGGLQSVEANAGPQIDQALIDAIRRAPCG
ncbi:envelope integrity protein Cei [Kibdelosporangium philippinense]|uniref:Envelope integrity protein Cei n=2 Tax=Kibdelosporangium philippinense TaxID=211113 RepID=A0ABS8ZPH5_9PSEU|nr:envelope integrity protein Cei [Kibdelosporangium philippinense]